MSVYPNPAQGWFTVRVNPEKIENMQIEVMNSLGQKIHRIDQNHIREVNRFNMTSEPGGIYFVKILSGKELLLHRVVMMK